MTQGADVGIRNKEGKSPLDYAKSKNHEGIIKLLKKASVEGKGL